MFFLVESQSPFWPASAAPIFLFFCFQAFFFLAAVPLRWAKGFRVPPSRVPKFLFFLTGSSAVFPSGGQPSGSVVISGLFFLFFFPSSLSRNLANFFSFFDFAPYLQRPGRRWARITAPNSLFFGQLSSRFSVLFPPLFLVFLGGLRQ